MAQEAGVQGDMREWRRRLGIGEVCNSMTANNVIRALNKGSVTVYDH